MASQISPFVTITHLNVKNSSMEKSNGTHRNLHKEIERSGFDNEDEQLR